MRPRPLDLGLVSERARRGHRNALTDVDGVAVGHVSLVKGKGPGAVRTGVTAILPHHEDDPYVTRYPAMAHIINGFGKSVGLNQVIELGELESPILITSTLNVWRVADGLVDWWTAKHPGARTYNPVVLECNDGPLSENTRRPLGGDAVQDALVAARVDDHSGGNVGAGVGMTAYGWKGGVGQASRIVDVEGVDCTLGVLVVTNCGRPADLRMGSAHVGQTLRPLSIAPYNPGSIAIVMATDAPVESRQLGRIARRAELGLGRTGHAGDQGSGDVVVAFGTGTHLGRVDDRDLDPLLAAAADIVEEAIYDSMLRAETIVGRDGHVRYAIDFEAVASLLGD